MSDFRKLLVLLSGLTILRVAWAWQTPLIAGEAYYWLWNWHPAAGYFDHPPMVGWLSLLLGGRVLGSALAVRTEPIILGIASAVVFYFLARRMFPARRTAFHAAALFAIAPIFDLNAMFLTPDNGLVLFATATWFCFWRAAERPAAVAPWIGAGVCAGLALLSKFHAWVMLPPLYLFLIFSPVHRAALRKPGPWLAMLVALAVLSPNLAWNAQHNWLNYAFQWRRSDLPDSGFEPSNPALYFLGPLATLGPPLYIAMLAALWKGWRAWRETADARWLYLLCAGAPLPMFLGALSFLTTISLHWPAPAYGALVLLGVALIHEGRLFRAPFIKPVFAAAAALTLVLHLAPAAIALLPHSVAAKREWVGWEALGERLRSERAVLLAADPGQPAILMAKSWHMTSLLAYYAREPYEASPFQAEDMHNYRLWIAPRGDLLGANAIVVIEKEEPMERHTRLSRKYDKYHRQLDPLFARVEPIPSLIVYADGRIGDELSASVEPPRLREFMLFRCTGFKGLFLREGSDVPLPLEPIGSTQSSK